MRQETIEARRTIEEVTGIKVKGIRLQTGSMRGLLHVTFDANEPAVKAFAENFYKPIPLQTDKRVLKGIEITFMGSEHKGKISFDISFNALKKRCPACHGMKLHLVEVRNALSRYCSKYICSDCGVREAFDGDFWHARAQFGDAIIPLR